MTLPVFHSRKDKEIFLKKIIHTLRISEPEKEIYSLCVDVLEDDAFEQFFGKIQNQVYEISGIYTLRDSGNLLSI